VKVLLNWQVNAKERALFEAALPPGTTILAQAPGPHFSRFDGTLESIAEVLPEVDAIVGWVLPEGALELSRKLKLLCWMHAGCDELDFAKLKRMGVQVANLRGANGIAVAEHAMALMLALAKRLNVKRQAVVEGEMKPLYLDGHRSGMLDGRTLGIIGLGQIGSAIAKRARPFDMRILGVRRHAERPCDAVDRVFPTGEMREMLGECDYVVLAAPMTKETNGFIGAAELAAMKPGAFLVNIGRGNLVQELPLYEALTTGRLAGYGSDVWWTYANSFPATYHFPIPSRTGLHKLPNVIGTGDQAANADDVLERNFAQAIATLVQYADGKPLTATIDLDAGY
jgi:phosphoglycerate dehydrogenase-like enzyme